MVDRQLGQKEKYIDHHENNLSLQSGVQAGLVVGQLNYILPGYGQSERLSDEVFMTRMVFRGVLQLHRYNPQLPGETNGRPYPSVHIAIWRDVLGQGGNDVMKIWDLPAPDNGLNMVNLRPMRNMLHTETHQMILDEVIDLKPTCTWVTAEDTRHTDGYNVSFEFIRDLNFTCAIPSGEPPVLRTNRMVMHAWALPEDSDIFSSALDVGLSFTTRCYFIDK